VVLVEHHVVNTTAESLEANLKANFWYAEQAPAREARRLLFENSFFVLHPQSESMAGHRCAMPEEFDLLTVTAHMHNNGRAFVAKLDGAAFYEAEGEDLNVPVQEQVHVTAGSSIEYECRYANLSDDVIIPGLDVQNNEMCVLFGVYTTPTDAPLSPDAATCSTPGSHPVFPGVHEDERTQGCAPAWSCASEAWFDHAADHESAEFKLAHIGCLDTMCAQATEAYWELERCVNDHCQDWCWVGQMCPEANCPECSQCMADQCADSRNACDAATCGG